MKKILLYWNHICILHNQEKRYLKELQETLFEKNIELEIKYFGLGYESHMSEYLLQKNAVIPDLIVSADLEVFENENIYNKFRQKLVPLKEQFEYKNSLLYHSINRDESLLPYVVIPLIYYTNKEDCCKKKRIIDIEHLSFGGIHNSAGKSIVKSTWDYYGKEYAKKLIMNSHIYDMPINAFIQTQRKQDNISLVPSIYAMRADHKEFKCCIPEEGPGLIPSYICCLNKNLEKESLEIIHHLYSDKWCEFYHNAGDLITMPKNSIESKWEKYEKYFITKTEWFEKVTSKEFYSIYQLIKDNQ